MSGVRKALECFATDGERAEFRRLSERAERIDAERQAITARLNVLRQRLSQRRLASERGIPFVTVKAKPAAAVKAAAREGA